VGKSLQDQLLSIGLVDKKQAKKINTEKRKKNKQKQHGGSTAAEEDSRRLRKALVEETERDRQLNRQRAAEAEQKAIAAQVRQLIEGNRQPRGEEEVPFNFSENGKVKRIWVSEPVRKKISTGRLAIVKLEGKHELVPPDIAEKIRSRSKKSVVLYNDPSQEPLPEDSKSDPDYAGYEVPDDLMW
jgi:uncharacterized protein YaiL (DUF2058 family)